LQERITKENKEDLVVIEDISFVSGSS